MWDTGGWTLNRDNPDIQYVVPRSGALGWLDTFALPARGRNDAAAYAWINFTMRPEMAAKVIKSVGNFSAAKGTAPFVDPRLKAQFVAAFPDNALKNIHWYPAIPPGWRKSKGACSTASRPPIERAGSGRGRGRQALRGSPRRRCAVVRGRARQLFFDFGPSGCGKTTLLRMIAGFIAPDSGDIAIGGNSMRGVAPNRRPVNMVFQQLALFPMMSVGENVAFGLARRGMGRAERMRAASRCWSASGSAAPRASGSMSFRAASGNAWR
jgi:hypothetical protein